MEPRQRLDEELLCLTSWLSLNSYEERARDAVARDFCLSVQSLGESRCVLVGSTVSGLYARFRLMRTSMLPTSDVNFIVGPCDAHPLEAFTNTLSAHIRDCALFRDVHTVTGESGNRIRALHTVAFPLLPNE